MTPTHNMRAKQKLDSKPPALPKWFVVRVTDHGYNRLSDTPKFEQLTRGGYIEAAGPGEAIMRAIGDHGAYSAEYRAYPVEGSGILQMELRVNAVEWDGKATDSIQYAQDQSQANPDNQPRFGDGHVPPPSFTRGDL